ncbi:NAD(P)-dependent oxidoreductase [Streptomyces sp. OE57]|uniref:NAD(P)-dependent oxidoreductase n=1 Tax=Streptomyces lacaronensis TaxID=3379885 RepID=UPI0039B793AF
MEVRKLRLLVVGANGGLGRQVVSHALKRGHRVTALVRRAEAMDTAEGLSIVEGAAGDHLPSVSHAVQGQEAVICALGNPLWLAGHRGPAVMARSASNLVTAMHLHDVQRIVVPLAWGSGESRYATSRPLRVLTRLLIRRDYQDFDTAEQILAASGLDYTVVYFGALTDQAATTAWQATGELRSPSPMAVSRADLAQCLVDVAEGPGCATHLAVSGGRTGGAA